MKIIIQAGGKGTRLEGLTHNKPKCLVPVNNLPIIFHAFKKFPQAEFFIIADYKTDVLEKYLNCFAGDYTYHLIKATKKGTASGLGAAVRSFAADEPFMILWCDLILSDSFQIPSKKGNYLGIAQDFECRWSFVDGRFEKTPSKENGVAGLFIFENKSYLANVPEEGALVDWLKTQPIAFKRLNLNGSKEIGTLLSYSENTDNSHRCRPFNQMKFEGDKVIKSGLNEMGRKIAQDECAWYKKVKGLGYEFIPEIYEYEPLIMKKVSGKNIFEYDCLTHSQKRTILSKLVHTLSSLHHLEDNQPVCREDVVANYYTKTFERLEKVEKLVPFADKEFIKINGNYYRNPFFEKEGIRRLVDEFMPSVFCLIHGDCTFSNLMFDTFNMRPVLIDPRGYFGRTKFYGDADYDWAKLYYSLVGNYDQFNCSKFTLDIREKEVEFAIKPNNWQDMEEYFFELLPSVKKRKIKFLHAIIWLSLTTYAWEDYDAICGAFYNGVLHLGEIL